MTLLCLVGMILVVAAATTDGACFLPSRGISACSGVLTIWELLSNFFLRLFSAEIDLTDERELRSVSSGDERSHVFSGDDRSRVFRVDEL